MTALPRSAPRDQGVDAAGVTGLVDALEHAADVEMHSLVVVRHGHVVAEGWWAPYSSDRLHLIYSLSKSFTSAALGLAVAEGLVDLDDPLTRHLPELGGDDVAHDPSLRHLATMASGHRRDTWDEVAAADPAEPLRAFLRLPADGEPGTTFAYNQPCTYAVAAAVQRRAGSTLTEYLRPRLLDPLGIGEVLWDQHPRGRDLGFTGLHARTEDVARLGLLHLQQGRWDGRQLLPAQWVAAATAPQVSTAGEANRDWAQGYGYQFWAARHGYRGDGAFGQLCVVLPEHDAVVAVTGASTDMQAVLDAMWRHLLPAFADAPLDGPDADRADDVLARRLHHLELPVPTGEASPGDENAWQAAVFAVPAGDGVPDAVREVRTERRDDGWWAVLDEDGATLQARLGTDGWATTEAASSAAGVPLAAGAAWQPDGSLEALLRFVETPHAVRVRLDLAARTAEVRWVTAPLRPTPLTRLAAPRG